VSACDDTDMHDRIRLRPATVEDAPALAAIYNPYIATTVISFEMEPVPVEQMGARVAKVLDAGLPWIVAEDVDVVADLGEHAPDAVVGFAYAGPFQERAAYDHSLEVTVYLREGETGRGVGTELYGALLDLVSDLPGTSKHAPAHALYSRIALPNDGSVALHERFGFSRVGTFSEVGRKQGRWIDVGIWELLLED